MTAALSIVIGLVVISVAYFLLRKPVHEYFAMRGDRLVACPENQETVAVRVDATRAAVSMAGGHEHIRLESCTRWPEKAGCGQECLKQIAASPIDCLVKTQVTRWYDGKACALCGKAIGPVDWMHHSPGVMAPGGQTLEWREVRPETLPEVFGTHHAICWDCHVAETFRRQRPDLVIDVPQPGPRPQ